MRIKNNYFYFIIWNFCSTIFWNTVRYCAPPICFVAIKPAGSGITEAWYLWIAWGQLQDGSLLRNLRYEAGIHQTQLPRRRRLVCKNTCHQWRRVWTDWVFRHARWYVHHAGVKIADLLSHKPLSSNETTRPVCLYNATPAAKSTIYLAISVGWMLGMAHATSMDGSARLAHPRLGRYSKQCIEYGNGVVWPLYV